MYYKIQYVCSSHIGKVRSMNQDNYICNSEYMESEENIIEFPLHGTILSKKTSLFGIFDGMGGEERGEVASYIAAQSACEYSMEGQTVDALHDLCIVANQKICEYAASHEIASMGTTAAILAFSERDISLCNIGDSKIFRFSDEQLEQISVDHIAFTPYGLKPPLSQNLGIPPEEMTLEPYLACGPYKDGDIYLICSDGLTDMVSNEEIAEVLNSEKIEKAIMTLQDKALVNGGKDNITIIICKIKHPLGWLFG